MDIEHRGVGQHIAATRQFTPFPARMKPAPSFWLWDGRAEARFGLSVNLLGPDSNAPHVRLQAGARGSRGGSYMWRPRRASPGRCTHRAGPLRPCREPSPSPERHTRDPGSVPRPTASHSPVGDADGTTKPLAPASRARGRAELHGSGPRPQACPRRGRGAPSAEPGARPAPTHSAARCSPRVAPRAPPPGGRPPPRCPAPGTAPPARCPPRRPLPAGCPRTHPLPGGGRALPPQRQPAPQQRRQLPQLLPQLHRRRLVGSAAGAPAAGQLRALTRRRHLHGAHNHAASRPRSAARARPPAPPAFPPRRPGPAPTHGPRAPRPRRAGGPGRRRKPRRPPPRPPAAELPPPRAAAPAAAVRR